MGGIQMEIRIDKDAAAYIVKKTDTKAVSLYLASSGGGWCAVKTPTVQLGKPTRDEQYDMYLVDGIEVYLSKHVKVHPNGIHIFMRKFLWIKDLAVDGIMLVL